MVRRISTTVAALAVAMIVYALFTGLILHRVSTKLIQVHCLHTPRTCPTCQASGPPSGVPIFGVRVPVSSVVAAACTLLAMPAVAEFMTYRRRRRRELNDQCVECGYEITKWRGRCPGC